MLSLNKNLPPHRTPGYKVYVSLDLIKPRTLFIDHLALIFCGFCFMSSLSSCLAHFVLFANDLTCSLKPPYLHLPLLQCLYAGPLIIPTYDMPNIMFTNLHTLSRPCLDVLSRSIRGRSGSVLCVMFSRRYLPTPNWLLLTCPCLSWYFLCLFLLCYLSLFSWCFPLSVFFFVIC